ncbi:MAG: hypothetical protein R2725_13495 [Solirubrobacterales bacterium]
MQTTMDRTGSNRESIPAGKLPKPGAAFICEPGITLAREIQRIGKSKHRPIYHLLFGLKVPVHVMGSGTWERHRFLEEPMARRTSTYGPPEFRAYIDTGHPANEYLCSKSKAAMVRLRQLTAAAAFDVACEDKDLLEDLLEGTRTDIDRDIRNGRALGVQLGAWPWWPICAARFDGGEEPWNFARERGLPDQWTELPRVVATYWAWRTGSSAPLRRHHEVREAELQTAA